MSIFLASLHQPRSSTRKETTSLLSLYAVQAAAPLLVFVTVLNTVVVDLTVLVLVAGAAVTVTVAVPALTVLVVKTVAVLADKVDVIVLVVVAELTTVNVD